MSQFNLQLVQKAQLDICNGTILKDFNQEQGADGICCVWVIENHLLKSNQQEFSNFSQKKGKK